MVLESTDKGQFEYRGETIIVGVNGRFRLESEKGTDVDHPSLEAAHKAVDNLLSVGEVDLAVINEHGEARRIRSIHGNTGNFLMHDGYSSTSSYGSSYYVDLPWVLQLIERRELLAGTVKSIGAMLDAVRLPTERGRAGSPDTLSRLKQTYLDLWNRNAELRPPADMFNFVMGLEGEPA